jgi:hypothetical protein
MSSLLDWYLTVSLMLQAGLLEEESRLVLAEWGLAELVLAEWGLAELVLAEWESRQAVT